eukprot:scpid13033/ scgid15388/ 
MDGKEPYCVNTRCQTIASKFQIIEIVSDLNMYFSLIYLRPARVLAIEKTRNSRWVRKFTCLDYFRPSLRSLSLLLGERILQWLQRWKFSFSIQILRLYRYYNSLLAFTITSRHRQQLEQAIFQIQAA